MSAADPAAWAELIASDLPAYADRVDGARLVVSVLPQGTTVHERVKTRLNWLETRKRVMEEAVMALRNLHAHGYPDLYPVIVDGEVHKAFSDLQRLITGALADFDPPPIMAVSVSDEHPAPTTKGG